MAYVAMVPVIYLTFEELDIPAAPYATLAIALFPFLGVTYSVFPRSNSLLRLLVFLAIWAYISDRKWVFIFSIALLPLIHRSILPMIGLMVLIGFWERKLKLWMLVPMCIPLAVYWLTGAIENGDWGWYFSGYRAPENVLGLPIADGLIGTVVLGLRGSLNDLLKGTFILIQFSVAVFLLFSRIWQSKPFLFALIVPVIFIGLVQPADEIWTLIIYTTYLVIPLMVYLNDKNYAWLENRTLWATILTGCFLSQIAWALYMVL
jgi:hypothetical protein